ncbi:MAG TPA: carboxy terminal-processing peptidase [Verrucomicrobiae bacterium]|jgi:carboxyl-terminal processing protease|nr:carboxy terminal-processing peptidase [Verrucomicrobiae bacterium]
MRRHLFSVHSIAAFLLLGWASANFAEPVKSTAAPDAEAISTTTAPTSAVTWAPGPHDGVIVETTAEMLHDWHYRHLIFDTNLSARLFTNYLDTLDPLRFHFLQSDLDEFEKYHTALGNLTRQGDTTPAYVIFNRFMLRLEQRTAYMAELLEAGPLEFTNDEEMPISRKTARYPKDMDEARQLWRQRLRHDYLQEKLADESPAGLAGLVLSRRDPTTLVLIWHDFHSNIVDVITRRNNRTLRYFKDWDNEKVLETYITSLGHVYDPHTDYYDKSDLDNFAIDITKTLFGIGATLTLNDEGYTTITDLIPSGPAAKSKKIKVNDRIVGVAQGTNDPVDVKDMPLNHVVDKIRGPKGTEVRLTIIPAGAIPSTRVTISLIRDEINLEDQRAKAQIIELAGANGKPLRLGVIDLPSFYASSMQFGDRNRPETVKSTTIDVARLLIKLKDEGVSGVILDLRRNGGGSLEEAINLPGLFIRQGPVVQIRGSDGRIDIKEDRDGPISMLYDGPLIVLTSRLSASASEIVAGALQDYHRAIVVGGKSTHGKGTVQSMSPLVPYLYLKKHEDVDMGDSVEALGALKYTTNKFYRVSGSSTQLKGVESDISLPSTYDYMDMLGETSLDNALPWDTIAAAEYDKLNCVQPFLPDLKARSALRVAADRDFTYVREDIEQVKKLMGDETISLNEDQRLKEADQNEARQKAREEELKTRKWPDEKIYDISLAQAELDGLPTPLIITNGMVLTNSAVITAANDSDASEPAIDTNAVASVGGDTPDAAPKPNAITAPADLPTEERASLLEAERILVDYVSLWNADTALSDRHSPN